MNKKHIESPCVVCGSFLHSDCEGANPFAEMHRLLTKCVQEANENPRSEHDFEAAFINASSYDDLVTAASLAAEHMKPA